jgi:hypothetical protein
MRKHFIHLYKFHDLKKNVSSLSPPQITRPFRTVHRSPTDINSSTPQTRVCREFLSPSSNLSRCTQTLTL